MHNEAKVIVFFTEGFGRLINKSNIVFRPNFGYFNRYLRAKINGCKFGFVVTKIRG